jgi:hypothetical protein
MFKRIGVFLLAGVIGAFCLELGEQIGIPGVHGLVSPAEATVGRPLTPVSVAGAENGAALNRRRLTSCTPFRGDAVKGAR